MIIRSYDLNYVLVTGFLGDDDEFWESININF
jgi:hypothetical protein